MSNRMLWTAALIYLAAVCLMPLSIIAQGNATVTGFVVDTDNKPIPDTTVEFYDHIRSVGQTVRTDLTGRYEFRSIPMRKYTARITPSNTDYYDLTVEVEVKIGGVLVTEDDRQVIFVLRRKKSSPPSKPEVVFEQDVPREARQHYEKGIADLERKKSVEGLNELKQAVAIFPTYYDALSRLGQEHLFAQRFQEARLSFSAAIIQYPVSFVDWYGLSLANYSMNRFDDAAWAGNKAVALKNSSAAALTILGISQRRMGKFDLAEKALVEAKKYDSAKTPVLYYELAMLYGEDLKRYREAADELGILLEAAPDSPQADKIKKMITDFRKKDAAPH